MTLACVAACTVVNCELLGNYATSVKRYCPGQSTTNQHTRPRIWWRSRLVFAVATHALRVPRATHEPRIYKAISPARSAPPSSIPSPHLPRALVARDTPSSLHSFSSVQSASRWRTSMPATLSGTVCDNGFVATYCLGPSWVLLVVCGHPRPLVNVVLIFHV